METSEGSTASTSGQCRNCGAELQGEWCHVCGQPVKGMIRHFRSVLSEILDTLFEYDNRIWRTLAPLYFRPGRITNDFIAGRRMRYVLPFRLFFVLSLVTFLFLQILAGPEPAIPAPQSIPVGNFDEAATVEEVNIERERARRELQDEIAGLEANPDIPAVAIASLRGAQGLVDQAAEHRIAELQGPEPLPLQPVTGLNFDLPAMDETLAVGWLPEFANRALNNWRERANRNLQRVNEEPGRLIEEMLGMLPLVLFIMMPIFALLLKLLYAFSGRLYMEHLLVALHSHSFLFLAILISIGLSWLAALSADVAVFGAGSGFLFSLSWMWIPLYLLLMQKNIYQQGWALTLFKYSLLGVLYSFMISIALLAAVLISLVNL